ncbi:MAG: DoxX family protein [Bacteroidales bacterium]
MKYLRVFSRLLLGIVFIFSGFVKAVDPLGSAYKFSDYFHAFQMGFLDGFSLPLGIFLPTFEMTLGLMLILGYRRKIVTWLVMIFMGFFTVLTLILAIFNPVEDCGCFGDALVLTNWETFFKNMVLMVFVVILFLYRNTPAPGGTASREWTAGALLLILSVIFSVWNYRHLPLLDFRPYDVGTVIQEEMQIPEGAPMDEYETTLVYRNRQTGETEEFSIENYPRDTTAWEFVSSQSKLIRKGYEPPIHDFAIMDEYGSDLTDRILSHRGYSLLMISYDLRGAGTDGLRKANDWSGLEVLADDFIFYAVTASPSEEVEHLAASIGLTYGFYSADEIMLKTVVRSNPGFVLIKNGTIVGKWAYRDFPIVSELDASWPGMIGNAAGPLDEESQILMEAGVMDPLSFDVVEFDRPALSLLFEDCSAAREKWVVAAFILGIVILLVFSHFTSPVRL